MTLTQRIITIALCVAGTMLTRFLPFLIFGGKRPTPKYVQYLGDMLPGAVFSMLVVYCLRNVQFTGGTCGLPEISSIVLTVLLHLKFRKMLVSIATGTVCYMVLVQMVY